MHRIVLSFALLLTTFFALPATHAQAQNARSWVASYGGGAACTRSSPCGTFAFALAATNAGGEINCVDQGDYASGSSTVVISKALTIDCEGVQPRFGYRGSGPAITVNASASDVVVLRGLTIGGNGFGDAGIFFLTGAALHIEDCVIRNFNGSSAGWGIVANPTLNIPAELFVSDAVSENNGTTSSGGGIWIFPQNVSNNITRVTLNRVEARNNFFGIKADGTGAVGLGMVGGVINMTMRDSVSSGNHSNGIVGTGPANGPSIIMTVEGSNSSQNATAGFGVIADSPKTTITLSNSTVMGNINGIGASNGGQLVSYRNNNVTLNSADGSPTSVVAPK